MGYKFAVYKLREAEPRRGISRRLYTSRDEEQVRGFSLLVIYMPLETFTEARREADGR